MDLGRRLATVDLDEAPTDDRRDDRRVVLGLHLVVDPVGRPAVVTEKLARREAPDRWRSLYVPTEVVERHGTARCLGDVHEAPQPDCSCGFHGTTEPGRRRPQLRRELAAAHVLGPDPDVVVLAVALSGRLVVHEHGVRARHQSVLASTPADRWLRMHGSGPDGSDPGRARRHPSCRRSPRWHVAPPGETSPAIAARPRPSWPGPRGPGVVGGRPPARREDPTWRS